MQAKKIIDNVLHTVRLHLIRILRKQSRIRWGVFIGLIGCLLGVWIVMGMVGKRPSKVATDQQERRQEVPTINAKKRLTHLNAYHFYLDDVYYQTKEVEYIMAPEKVGLEADQDVLKKMLRQHPIFDNADEMLQMEMNKILP